MLDVPPSRRQLDVLGICLETGSVKEAARPLGISYDRTRKILASLYRELGVTNMAQAVEKLDRTEPGWTRGHHKL